VLIFHERCEDEQTMISRFERSSEWNRPRVGDRKDSPLLQRAPTLEQSLLSPWEAFLGTLFQTDIHFINIDIFIDSLQGY
jgi:hypothetical protein